MKDTTQKTATFLRQLALTLIVALLVAAQTAWAQDLPKLTYDEESETYSISSEQDLKTLSAYVEAGNNCEGLTFQVTTSIQFTEPSPGKSNFTAIGSSDHPFCGTFDGGNNNGYSISGIVINASTNNQGLFGYVGEYEKHATIRNVTIENSVINSTAGYVGGIVGCNYYGSIENCTSSATVSGDGGYCGGIVGYSCYGSIENCTSSATVSGDDDYCGGIVGYNDHGSIKNCTSSARVSAKRYGGGIAGSNWGELKGNFSINAVISSSYTDGAGAIVGWNSDGASLTNNYYNNCTVNGTPKATGVGCSGVDIDNNDGAIAVHTITPADGITITSTANPPITHNNTDKYYKAGITVELSCDNVSQGDLVVVNNIIINNNTFTMPDEDVVVRVISNYCTFSLPECFEITDGCLIGGKYVETNTTIQFATKFGYKVLSDVTCNDVNIHPTEGIYTITVTEKEMTIVPPLFKTGIWEIYTVNNLKEFSKMVNDDGKTFEGEMVTLMNTIDFKPSPGGSTFTAIGTSNHPFCGTFDGGNTNGYSIKGIVINTSTYNQGLFGYIGEYEKYATIRNVTIEDSEINSIVGYVGGIVGYNNYGSIENCTSSATVSGDRGYYGGIVGYNHYGSIENCTSSATVSGDGDYFGGIVGYNNYGAIENCTSSATVSGVEYGDNYGGIVGYNDDGTVKNCTSRAEISTTGSNCEYYGGIAGYDSGTLSNNFVIDAKIEANIELIGAIAGDSYGSLTNNYYYNCTANEKTTEIGVYDGDHSSNDGAVPATKPVQQLTLPVCFEITEGVILGSNYVEKGAEIQFALKFGYTKPTSVSILGGGSLTQDTYGFYYTVKVDRDMTIVAESTPTEYEIATYADLILFSNAVNKGNNFEGKTITVTDNINFPAPKEEGESNFTAIGTSDHRFCGTFDGGGYTISGIVINASTDYQGLFGYIGEYGKYAKIQNVTIENSEINSTAWYVGGIVGYNNYGSIENCTSSATISASYYGGGIAGYNPSDCTIENCTSSATVSAADYGGGIVGGNGGELKGNFSINAVISSSYTYDAGAIVAYDWNTKPLLTNNYYNNCTVNGTPKATDVGCRGGDIDNNDGAMPADLLIDGDSEEAVVVSDTKENQTVAFRRSFKTDITATVILPFDFDANTYFKGKGTFYTLAEVSYNNETSQWEATPSDPIVDIKANIPYIFKPTADFDIVAFNGVKVEQNTGISKASSEIEISVATNAEKWNLVGVYTNKTWSVRTPNEYGFAAKQISYTDNETKEEVNITAGEFVRAGANAKMKPTRAYLRYEGDNVVLNPGIQSKSAAELPDRIVLIFPDETASVIDNPSDDPSDSGDVTTPTSELVNPAVSAKVWAYDKTIFIAAAPNTAYRIVDANGRLLKESATQTDRDEIRLGSRSGIVIVIIGGKAYKVNY